MSDEHAPDWEMTHEQVVSILHGYVATGVLARRGYSDTLGLESALDHAVVGLAIATKRTPAQVLEAAKERQPDGAAWHDTQGELLHAWHDRVEEWVRIIKDAGEPPRGEFQ